ncbi:acetolactate synthase small subunit [Actinomycetaceae bacterium WB03_NA08]|uniref:Acetolactate synthase small subunit n=1 Tax=Scrofimicrobium canadense TaxID=2652290 RepID=A0A6N7VVC9_9ACTO|nr:acetolactate synthase small subunit [Scrofimicrobium canadense]MSS84940.1 acetolactate synthase small subunit [Scrofimicrobium canadense]
MEHLHTLSILVENKPGVLTRVAGLFARRNFNIKSLTVGETEDISISRMTIIVDAEEVPLEQVTKQLNKLINVLKVVEMPPAESVERRLLLLKVRADESCRTAVLQIVDLFRAHVVDVQADTVIVESIGSRQKLEALLASLEPYGVRELAQSGAVAIGRGSKSITDQIKEN